MARQGVVSIDQGSQSTRIIVYDANDVSSVIAQASAPVQRHCPRSGWVEFEPKDIIESVIACAKTVASQLSSSGDSVSLLCAGITNQRESTIAWRRSTGEALAPGISWSDVRTADLVASMTKAFGSPHVFRGITGLPINSYFSALKMRWLLENISGVRVALENEDLCFGTVDTYIMWQLGAAEKGGRQPFVTDVTNASRTLLMNLRTQQWDTKLLGVFHVPVGCLPRIHSSSYNCFARLQHADLPEMFQGLQVCGVLGDQHASLLGHLCIQPGRAKCTFGSGAFYMVTTGSEIIQSRTGLLTTMGFRLGENQPPVFALEGSIGSAGIGVSWMKNNLGILADDLEIGEVLRSTPSSDGVTFVPAFSGLMAPFWRPDARGVVSGVSQLTTKKHVIRAYFEAICFTLRMIISLAATDVGAHRTPMNIRLRFRQLLSKLWELDVPVQLTMTASSARKAGSDVEAAVRYYLYAGCYYMMLGVLAFFTGAEVLLELGKMTLSSLYLAIISFGVEPSARGNKEEHTWPEAIHPLTHIRAVDTISVDGGLTKCEEFNQLLADSLARTVVRPPSGAEATAFGVAIAAMLGKGTWDIQQLQQYAHKREEAGDMYRPRKDTSFAKHQDELEKRWRSIVNVACSS